MNLDDLTIGQAKSLASLFSSSNKQKIDNGLIGKYVIVRCRDAGVHAGILESYNGREAVLLEARRLWYWKCIKGFSLSGVANYGLHQDSKISSPIKVHLTETCEIIETTEESKKSISEMKSHQE